MRAQTHPGLPFWHTVLGRLAQLFCDDGGGGGSGALISSVSKLDDAIWRARADSKTHRNSTQGACLPSYLQKVCKHDFGLLRIRHQSHPGQKPKSNTTRAAVVLRQAVSCRIKGTAAAPDLHHLIRPQAAVQNTGQACSTPTEPAVRKSL